MGRAAARQFRCLQHANQNIQTAMTLPNITLATGPGGAGTCTQAIFNAGQCLGTQPMHNVTFNGRSARVYGVGMGYHGHPHSAADARMSRAAISMRATPISTLPRRPGYLLPNGNSLTCRGTPFPLPAWQTNVTANYSFGLHQIGDVSIGDPGPHCPLLLAEPLSGGSARLQSVAANLVLRDAELAAGS